VQRRGFLTIASGAPLYLRMGLALARSVRLRNSNVELAVVTDACGDIFSGLYDHVIRFNPEFGRGVQQKLYLDRYTPFEETIYIDADCLAYEDLDLLWGMYAGSPGFGVKGADYLGAASSHYGVSDFRKYLGCYGVTRIGNFNGGIYYFDHGAVAARVFESARQISAERDRVGLTPFKNSPVADEPIMAMAMELNGVPMLPWDGGRAMSTTLGDTRGLSALDVLKGRSAFVKRGVPVQPIVVHFNIGCQNFFVYRRELHRLALPEWLPRSELANLTVVPEYLSIRTAYYAGRLRSGIRNYGLIGVVPERLLERFGVRRAGSKELHEHGSSSA
jgi:hypothetical protein